MARFRYYEIECDSECGGSVTERIGRDAERVARQLGWKLRDKVVGDQCGECQAKEQDSQQRL